MLDINLLRDVLFWMLKSVGYATKNLQDYPMPTTR